MNVRIQLSSQKKPVVLNDVRNTYLSDGFICILFEDLTVERYRVGDVSEITEFS